MERVILHSDLNNFFASVETALHPEYRGVPLIVCGDPKERRGIVLAKNYEAKAFGIVTAETVASAVRKCPNVLRISPHFHEYNRFSHAVRDIYARYTDQIKVCSIDECALDVSASIRLFGSGEKIADSIRRTVKDELGLTVSVGVSFNKVFAKLASELKKPDAVSVVSKENFRTVVWNLPVGDLLYVGKATAEILTKHGKRTIGDLARSSVEEIVRILGKRGDVLWAYANGLDDEPVKTDRDEVKSIGNSVTLPNDVTDKFEIKRVIYQLAENVAERLRHANVGKCDTVHITVKDALFKEHVKQVKVRPTELCSDIAEAAFSLFENLWKNGGAVRLIGVTVSGFDNFTEQIGLFNVDENGVPYDKKKKAEDAVSEIRKKYGMAKLQRGITMEDETVSVGIFKERND